MVKKEKGYTKERHCSIIRNIFKGQDNDVSKYLCSKKSEVVIVLHNLANKFYLLYISISKIAKTSMLVILELFAIQLKRCTDPVDVTIL